APRPWVCVASRAPPASRRARPSPRAPEEAGDAGGVPRRPEEAEDTGLAAHYPRAMRHRLCLAAAVAGLAAMLLAGCDGGAGPPKDEPSTPHPSTSDPATSPTSQTPTPTHDPGEPATNP